MAFSYLQLSQCQPFLILVLSTAIAVTRITLLIRLEKEDLDKPFFSIESNWQIRGVIQLHHKPSTPVRFERRCVGDQPAAGIGAFADRQSGYVSRYLKSLDRHAKRIRMRWQKPVVRTVVGSANRYIEKTVGI